MTLTPTSDDHSLLRAYAASRDPEAFAELARRYAGLVLSTAQRITNSPHDAEDITQTCFLELAKNAPRVTSIPGYLHRAATTRSLNLLRDNKTRRAREIQSPLIKPDLTWQQLLPLVDSAINQLPDDLRIPLILHYQQSKSQSEIASSLKLSQPTVSRRLDSAIAELRKHLAKMGEGAGAGVVVGGLSVAVTTVALSQTAAPTPPILLLSSLNKIGLSGVGHTAVAGAATASLAKIIALVLITSAFALVLIYYFPRQNGSSAPAVPPASALPPAPSSSSTIEPLVPPAPTLTLISNWQSLYPSPVASLSPDGSLVACASTLHSEPAPAGNDTTTSLALYSAATHERLQSFPGHSRLITAVAFSPDGNLLASGSRDGTLRVWDPLTGDELHHFAIKNVWFTALAFSPDSKNLFAAAAFNMDANPAAPTSSLYNYDLTQEKPLTPFPPFERTLITALAVSPGASQLAIASKNADITLYDLATAKELARLDRTAAVSALAFTPDGHLIAADQSITLWNLTTHSPDAAFPTPTPISSLSLSNNQLLTASPNSLLTLWHITIPR